MGTASIKNLTLTHSPVGHNAFIAYLPEPVQASYPYLLHTLSQRMQSEGAIDCVIAYNSLLVIFDPNKQQASVLSMALDEQLSVAIESHQAEVKRRTIHIPVCYEPPYALDLATASQHANLSSDEFIARHSGKTYDVCCTGFIPGFAFLGYVDEAIAAPRHSEPRAQIPAGSVGIAGQQTGVYPAASPGGWQIIGRTPMTLYAPERGIFSRFEIGDKVVFYPITAEAFETWSEENE